MCNAEIARAIAAQIQGELHARKQRLFQEIRAYPTPIAGCDQQFNFLLEQQTNVVGDLALVQQAVAALPGHVDPARLFEALIRSMRSLDDDAKRRLLARL
jgi:hypothetical protein